MNALPPSSPALYTFTLNPSLDKTLLVSRLQPGELHRATVERTEIGGKGINVSRALALLGLHSTAFALIGHRERQRFRQELDDLGIGAQLFPHNGETRTNISIQEVGSERQTKINEAGPTLTPELAAMMLQYATDTLLPNSLIALSGSLPPGVPTHFYANAVRQWREQRPTARTFVDADGSALFAAADAPPFALKINHTEASHLLNTTLEQDDDFPLAFAELFRRGIEVVAITRGAKGCAYATAREGSLIFATPPPNRPIQSAVAAGDAAMAGLLWSIAENCNAETTARRIVACGTAAAMQPGSGVGNRADVEALLPDVQTQRVTL